VSVAETVSALSRGRQALIIGRPDGAGPSPFRAGAGARPAADPAAAPPSLYAAATAVLPERRLTWWHTDLDPRLALLPPEGITHGAPSPLRVPALRLDHVEGTAAVLPGNDGAIEWTAAEVARVVELVLEHARQRRDRSLAVLTLTADMAHLVRDGVRDAIGRLDGDAEAGEFLAGVGVEPFVVAQVDEADGLLRDVVLLSVGYGRTPHGRVLHRFPALTAPGGEAALIAATARARQELVVVSTLRAGDLDAGRLRATPAGRLLELLAHAEAGGIHEGQASTAQSEDPLMSYLASRLRQEGLTVQAQMGVGPHRVELAVGHPSVADRWLVAVESDGPGYAALPGVRARDVLRPRQLRRLGWEPIRVWSTDLYRDPAPEVVRVVAAVTAALRARNSHAAAQLGATAQAEKPTVPAEAEASTVPGTAEASTVPSEAEASTAPAEAEASTAPAEAEASTVPAEGPTGESSKPKRRKRLRRGDVERSADDTDTGWGERPRSGDEHDRWLQEQRPPHWE
jgi:very-short-patch-repair endonuclease